MSSAFTRALPGAVVLSLLSGGLWAQGFEGMVTWKMGSRQMVQSYKGNLVRTDMGGAREGSMIMDVTAGTVMMLMDKEKMYMVMDLKGQQQPQGGDRSDKPPSITATGRTETIAGRSCEVFRYAEQAGKPETRELCVARGMGFLRLGSGGGMMGRGRDPMGDIAGAAANPHYARLYRDGFFPLRISKVEKDTVVDQMVATKVEPKTLDASLFQPPADYTEMKMPGGMQMPQRP